MEINLTKSEQELIQKNILAANIEEKFQYKSFREYIPLMIGNGAIGGCLDPLGGTTFDEMKLADIKYDGHGHTNDKNDIRKLKLTRIISYDYKIIEERHPDRIEAYGEPFIYYLAPQVADPLTKITDHRQQLDLNSGIITTYYNLEDKACKIQTFIDQHESVFVYRIENETPLVFRIYSERPIYDAGGYTQVYDQQKLLQTQYMSASPQKDMLTAESISNRYCPMFCAAVSDKQLQFDDGWIIPPGTTNLYIAYGHQSLNESQASASAKAMAVKKTGFDGIKQRNIRFWEDFWNRSYIDIPNKRWLKAWYRSLYYLACSSPRQIKAVTQTSGLSGIFPAFAGYGVQDSTFHLMAMNSAGHSDLIEMELELILEALPQARHAARNIFFANGARYPWGGQMNLQWYSPSHPAFKNTFYEHHVNACILLTITQFLESKGNPIELVQKYYPVISGIAEFYSSLTTEKDGSIQLLKLPTQSIVETAEHVNRTNPFDHLVSAKWSLATAAGYARKMNDEKSFKLWDKVSRKINLNVCLNEGVFGMFSGDTGLFEKEPGQYMGICLFPVFEEYRETFEATYYHTKAITDVGMCAWTPGYSSVTAARLGKTKDAEKDLQELFDFATPDDITFLENIVHVPGRMPYYMAAHAWFVMAVNEMLLQSYGGETILFPACPWEKCSFRLPAKDKFITAGKTGKTIRQI